MRLEVRVNEAPDANERLKRLARLLLGPPQKEIDDAELLTEPASSTISERSHRNETT